MATRRRAPAKSLSGSEAPALLRLVYMVVPKHVVNRILPPDASLPRQVQPPCPRHSAAQLSGKGGEGPREPRQTTWSAWRAAAGRRSCRSTSLSRCGCCRVMMRCAALCRQRPFMQRAFSWARGWRPSWSRLGFMRWQRARRRVRTSLLPSGSREHAHTPTEANASARVRANERGASPHRPCSHGHLSWLLPRRGVSASRDASASRVKACGKCAQAPGFADWRIAVAHRETGASEVGEGGSSTPQGRWRQIAACARKN